MPYYFGKNLASEVKAPIFLTDVNTAHLIFVGATRSGKTVAMNQIAAQVLRQGHSCVFLDPKGDASIHHEVRAKGPPGIPYRFFTYTTYLHPTLLWNPLDEPYQEFFEPNYLAAAFNRATGLSHGPGHGVEFWEALNETLSKIAFENCPGEHRTIADLNEFLNNPGNIRAASADWIKDKLLREGAGTKIVYERLAAVPMLNQSHKHPDYHDRLQLTESVCEPSWTYIHAPTEPAPPVALAILRMALSAVSTAAWLANQPGSPLPRKSKYLYLFIDELPLISDSHGIGLLFNTLASAGIRLVASCQSFADLDKSEILSNVLDNAGAIIDFRPEVNHRYWLDKAKTVLRWHPDATSTDKRVEYPLYSKQDLNRLSHYPGTGLMWIRDAGQFGDYQGEPIPFSTLFMTKTADYERYAQMPIKKEKGMVEFGRKKQPGPEEPQSNPDSNKRTEKTYTFYSDLEDERERRKQNWKQ